MGSGVFVIILKCEKLDLNVIVIDILFEVMNMVCNNVEKY